jgi:SAM-dependent methyltransferase
MEWCVENHLLPHTMRIFYWIKMAHQEQLNFVRTTSQCLTEDYSNRKVLEIGSFDVNGSIRQFFEKSTYVGVDLTEGPGVDVVCEGNKLDHPDQTYDVTLSCECFEHNPHWPETFLNMYRMTKSGGVVVFTCATTGRPEHGTTRTSPAVSPGSQSMGWDYYQNLTEFDFENTFKLNELFESYFFLSNKSSFDLYFVGLKIGALNIFNLDVMSLKDRCVQTQNAFELRKKREKFTPKIFRPLFHRLLD